MDLLYFLRILLRRKWLILGMSLLAVVVTFVFKLFQDRLYQSKAQYSTGFTIDRVKLTEGSSVADLYAADTKFSNVIETFKSPRVIGMISYQLLLHDLENPAEAWYKPNEKERESKVYNSVSADSIISILNRKIAANELLRSDIPDQRDIMEFLKLYKYDYQSILWNLTIERVNKTDFLDVIFRSGNPYLSAWVVNALGNEFLNYYKNMNFQRSVENISNIRQLEIQQQDKIDSLNNTLLAVKMSQGSIDPQSVSSSAMETVKELEGKYADEKSKYDLNSNRITFLKKELATLSNQGTSNNTELLDLIDQKTKLEAQLIAKGGNDAQIEHDLSNVRNQITAKSGNTTSRLRTSDRIADLNNQINEATAAMNASQATMEDYQKRMDYYQKLTRLNPESGVRMDVIKSKLDVEQKQLANLKDKLNQAEGLSKDDPSANFTQTLLGQPAVYPESRKIPMAMGISGFSVFFLMSFAFLFLEVANPAIKTVYGFEKSVPLSLKGTINTIKVKPDELALILLEEKNKKASFNLFRNNIKKLRYEMVNTGKKVFLFTSTATGTGKSFLIESLALSMILLKKKILIVDFNLHNNTLTKRFNADATVQQLNEKANPALPFNVSGFVSKTDSDYISILGCEETSQSPSEVLFRFNFDEFLETVKENYDYVFIEGPSLNKFSDTNEIAGFADKVVSIFSANQGITHLDQSSVNYLQSLESKNFGAVLNNVLPENMNF